MLKGTIKNIEWAWNLDKKWCNVHVMVYYAIKQDYIHPSDQSDPSHPSQPGKLSHLC